MTDFTKGEEVIYVSNGKRVKAKIISIHYDDVELYYTISLDGRERQTDNNHLEKISESIFNNSRNRIKICGSCNHQIINNTYVEELNMILCPNCFLLAIKNGYVCFNNNDFVLIDRNHIYNEEYVYDISELQRILLDKYPEFYQIG